MILFEKALAIVSAEALPLETEEVSLENACGRVLAADVISDIDMPPFPKSAVDGFACRKADVKTGAELIVIETIPAGSSPLKTPGSGECSRIMTGGMLPPGADAVVMVEDTSVSSDNRIRLVKAGKTENVCLPAEDLKKGEKVLEKGKRILPADVAVLATVGCYRVRVFSVPKVGILSTGNELVEPWETPGGPKIRNSNSFQLMAQASQIPASCRYFGIAGDTEDELFDKMKEALGLCDVLILSGGVSMGDFDHVPAAMERTGAEILFRKIAIQPGKPTVFARAGRRYIFGLPGNPVSSFVLFELLVKPFLLRMTGCSEMPAELMLPIGEDYRRKSAERKSVIPIMIRDSKVHPVSYHGSAHINAYSGADGMMFMEIGQTEVRMNDPVHVRLL
jgi:molybdopterin molybdotransferase